MKKLYTILTMLMLMCASGAWAALSSNTIAKSGNVTDTWSISTTMPTDNWTAMGNSAPAGVTALGGTPYYKTQDITLSADGALFITFKYSSGSHRLDILGVDLLNSNDEVVRSDYHSGYTGTNREHNVYMLDHIASGAYKIRFIINGATVSSSVGNITIQHINIKTADSYANITQWYFVRMHSNQTHYMYYNSDNARGIDFAGSSQKNANYLWGFVKDMDGIRIYNKAAGSSVAIDNANPCTLSSDGTSQTFTFFTSAAGSYGSAAGAYFSLYKLTSGSSNSYLNWRSDNTIQRWTDNDAGSTVMIDEVPMFTVESNINAGGVTYNQTYDGTVTQTKGGFYVLNTAPSASDFTAISVENYTAGNVVVDATAKTITVNYTANITYTLTDTNGQTYSWSASGTFGTTPTLTGCDGYTLSNEVWNESSRTYTANISFPFPVSSNNVTNYTYIGQFHNKGSIGGRTSKDFLWHAESSGVIVHNYDAPTNESGINEKYKWAIYPSISAGAITFKIKNSSSGYISTTYTGADSGGHAVGNVTHTAEASEATPVIYYNYTGSNYAFKTTTTSRHLSVNSVNGNENQVLGVYSGTHDGISVAFYTPADFTTLMANLKTARNLFNSYFLPWSQGKYTETVEGTMTTAYAQQETDRNVVKDSPTAYFTATQFKTNTDNYNNAVAGLRYVVPTFFRVKNLAGTKYVKDLDANYTADETLDFSEGGTDAASIFYIDSSNKVIAYNSGLYLFATNNTPRLSLQAYANTYEFLNGSALYQVYVHSATNPLGWGGSDLYWQYTENGTKIGRVASTESASEFLIETVETLPVTMHQVGTDYYATLCLPVDVTITGATAYTLAVAGSGDNKYLTPTAVKDNKVPAGTPVMLKGTNETATATINTGESFGSALTCALTGTYAAIDVSSTNDTDYFLGRYREDASSQYEVGFYHWDGTVLKGFRAYLEAIKLSGAGANGFSIVWDETTGISGLTPALSEGEGAVYDLQGRRLGQWSAVNGQLPRGIYVVNGKKVVVK